MRSSGVKLGKLYGLNAAVNWPARDSVALIGASSVMVVEVWVLLFRLLLLLLSVLVVGVVVFDAWEWRCAVSIRQLNTAAEDPDN